MEEALRIVRVDRWDHRYWKAIRKGWGIHSDKGTSSLCPYAHTMLWLSVLTCLFSGFIILGWIVVKILRLAYKGCTIIPPLQWLADLADHVKFSEKLKEVGDDVKKSPLITCAMVGLLVMLSILCAMLVVGVLLFGVTKLTVLIWGILPEIIPAIWTAILYVGWVLFYVFGTIGAVLAAIGIGCWWIGWAFSFAAVAVWSVISAAQLWHFIGMLAFWFVVTLALSTVCMFTLYILFTAKWAQPMLEWFVFTFNGFNESRERASQRRVDKKKTAASGEKKQATGYSMGRELKQIFGVLLEWVAAFFVAILIGIYNIFAAIWYPFAVLGGFFFAQRVYVSGGTYKIMGGLSIFWDWFASIYHGKLCPTLTFMTNEQIDAEVRTFMVFRDPTGVMSRIVAIHKNNVIKEEKRLQADIDDGEHVEQNTARLQALRRAKPVVADDPWQARDIFGREEQEGVPGGEPKQ